jgi:hypothetical protein
MADLRELSGPVGSCAEASPQNSHNPSFRGVGPHRKPTDKAAQSGMSAIMNS